MTITNFGGITGELAIQQLCLDPLNPRLPDTYHGATQELLLKCIAETFNAIAVAKSIALHGYFPSEPLIVTNKVDNNYTVVEGNRRLVALKILAEPDLAVGLEDEDYWSELSDQAVLPEKIPVVIAPDKRSVAPIVGYRHISGIEPWEPYAKARFIASLVDDDDLQFEAVADLVGERTTDVAANYRNCAIVAQVKDDFGMDPTHVTRRFGVFNRVMTSLPLRTYIGAPAPADVIPGTNPLSDDSAPRTKELLSWVFGDGENNPVIAESRDITNLGHVVSSEDSLRILKETRDLETAFLASGGLRERLLRRLLNANNNLEAAREDIVAFFSDAEVQQLLDNCQTSLKRLVELDEQN